MTANDLRNLFMGNRVGSGSSGLAGLLLNPDDPMQVPSGLEALLAPLPSNTGQYGDTPTPAVMRYPDGVAPRWLLHPFSATPATGSQPANTLAITPTPAPPAVETSLPATADPEEKAPQSTALADSIRDGMRPNLGFLGNLIRTQTGSDFSKDLFENYWLAKGDYKLPSSRFQDIVNYIDTSHPSFKDGGNVRLPDGTPLTKRVYDFYSSPEYRNALGSASVYFNAAGKPVGFYDYYNFDPDPSGSKGRSPEAERKVDIMAKLGPWHGAKPFPLSYGQYVPPTGNPDADAN